METDYLREFNRMLAEDRIHPEYRHQMAGHRLADTIYVLLEDKGWTTTELSRRARLSMKAFRRLETLSGMGDFTLAELLRIADALESSISISFSPITATVTTGAGWTVKACSNDEPTQCRNDQWRTFPGVNKSIIAKEKKGKSGEITCVAA